MFKYFKKQDFKIKCWSHQVCLINKWRSAEFLKLDSCLTQLGYLSSLLRCFLSQSRHLLDSWSIDREIFCLLDSFSTPGGSIPWHLARHLLDILSVELYEFQIFRFDFQPMFMCLCRVSFLTTLDLYKAYFRGCHIWEYKENICKRWPKPYSL